MQPHSYLVMMAVNHFGAWLMDGMGGLSAAGGRMAAEQLRLPRWYRPIFLHNLGVFLMTLNKAKNDG